MGNRAEAQRLFAQAKHVADTDKTQLSVAYVLFASACAADPTWAEAQYFQGNNAGDLRWNETAIALYHRALECDPDSQLKARILTNLGWKLHTIGKLKEALQASRDAVEINQAIPAAWLNLSCIYGAMRNTARSVECGLKAKALAPDDPHVGMALSFAYLFDRQWQKGFAEFECRFRYRLHHFLHYPYPEWKGEEGHSVFLVYDQGLGDTLSFARFVEPAAKRCRYLHVCIQPELLHWFQVAFSHLSNVHIIPGAVQFPGDAEFWSTYVSLPYALGLTDREIEEAPPIRLPPVQPSGMWKVSDRKLHIGIAWAGSPLNENNYHRSIPLVRFLDLYRVPGIQLYSLQVDEHRKHLNDIGAGSLIPDLAHYIRGVSDTLSLVRQLDLVITCESAL